jgi:hypothetical protein
MAQSLETYGVAWHLPMQDFMQGAWIERLDTALNAEQNWPALERNGAQKAAERLGQM